MCPVFGGKYKFKIKIPYFNIEMAYLALKLSAFEMWVWRRMEKVSWRDKKTNEQVLHDVNEKRSLLEEVLKRKKNWIGHVVRGEGLLKQVMEGRMEGKRPRGRPRIGMIDDLIENSYVEMKRRAENRDAWRYWMPRTCHKAENEF